VGGKKMDYKFIKDYKNNTELRQSFNTLATETFGINFEKWYQGGYWNDHYICYSYVLDNAVVSNVSLSTMRLLMDGEIKNVIQIGTVMTDPKHRRKGLALDLMKKIFEDYDSEYDFYFLAADAEAVPLYQKCKFKSVDNYKHVIDVSKYDLTLKTPLKTVSVEGATILQHKLESKSLTSKLWALDAEHVFMFYYTLGFNNNIYKVEDQFVILEIEDNILHLYDVLSKHPVDLNQLIKKITPEGINQVVCHFTPGGDVQHMKSEIDPSSSWMIRTTKNETFPVGTRFPQIAQT